MMGITIRQLPNDIYWIARGNCARQRLPMSKEYLLHKCFDWSLTKQGFCFWESYYKASYYGVMATNIRLKKKCSQK